MADHAIVTEGLTKRYGKRRGIVDVSLAVERGEVFGYLGPNGAGKTTTIRILLDLIRPSAGHATVLGLDSRRDGIEIHRRTGYLAGEYGLYERLDGRGYLRYLASLRGGVGQASIDGLAERLRLDLDDPVRQMSHGNRQKLGLVQAFMHDPELVIVDEPTSGLDPLIQQEFHRLVAERRDAGVTIFLSSHVLPEVERMCDRVGVIRDGMLIAVEDVSTLKARSLRTVEIRFAHPVPVEAFSTLDGVRSASADGPTITLGVSGAMDAIVKAAAAFEVIDVVSQEPSLEEIFLAFYGQDARETEPETADAA